MTDVCRPQLIWINGSCYRINGQNQDEKREFYGGDAPDEYEDEIGCGLENSNETNDCKYEITELENGKFKAVFHVASAFFAVIIGKKGATKKRIESDTKTRILIPKQGVENEDIQVVGDAKYFVGSACNRIDSIVSSARQRQGFTHFLSIPCNSPEMQKSLQEFQKSVMEYCEKETRGLDSTVFQTPSLLHMTIGTLALMDEVERQKAKGILEEAIKEIKFKMPIKIRFQGLEIMNDDPAEVDVIYAKVHECEELQKLADGLVSKFADTGLMPRQFDRVKLHVTLINTIFRKGEDYEESQKRETLDSRPIFQFFDDFSFGSMNLTEVHLSQRRAGKRSKENYYFPSAIVSL